MGGIKKQDLDISHVSACSILNVSCQRSNTWVNGLGNRTLLFNHKSKPLQAISKSQLQIDWVLRQRDCLYQASLEQYGNLEVLYPNSLWKDCDATQLIPELLDTTFVLELLRSQFGCAKDPAMSLTEFRQGHSTAASALIMKQRLVKV
jgi:hypothetical protein